MKVMAPGFEGTDYAQKLSVIDFIISLGCIERVGDVAAGVPVTVNVLLAEDATSCPFRGICLHDERFFVIWHKKDWCFLEFLFQVFERLLAFF